MRREFTGRHMLFTLVGGFGVVVAVNFYMASLASSTFGGITVENSYVASQRFNGWLERARAQDALGWQASIARDAAGHVVVTTAGVPPGASMAAVLRHPLGKKADVDLAFVEETPGRYRSLEAPGRGRWTARLTIAAGAARWAHEVALPGA